jgi:DNA-binding MarR family transcriptional regulator
MIMSIPSRQQGPEVALWLGTRIQSEYLEMPGLRLTVSQAARLFALDPATSAAALDSLVAIGFLRRTRDGAYLRTSLG